MSEGSEPIGSAAEEALRLLAALTELGREHGSEASGSPEGEDCRWCPICRMAHAVRRTSPEVRAHLGSAAASLLHAASAFLAEAERTPGDEPAERVEKIDLDGSEED